MIIKLEEEHLLLIPLNKLTTEFIPSIIVPAHQSKQDTRKAFTADLIHTPAFFLELPPVDGIGVVFFAGSNCDPVIYRIQKQLHILHILELV